MRGIEEITKTTRTREKITSYSTQLVVKNVRISILDGRAYKFREKSEIDFEKVGIHLKELRELVDVITAIKQNISRAESGMSDAQNNISTLQVSLSKNLEGLDTALSS